VQGLQFARRPVEFFERCRRRYGKAVTFKLPGFGKIVWIVDPGAVKELFSHPDVLHAGKAANVIEPVVGPNSVLTLDGPEHLRQRKLLLPPFHGESVRRYGELIAGLADREVAAWPRGRRFALRPRMQRLTLEVILRTVFGLREEARLAEFTRAVDRLVRLANLMGLPQGVRRDLGRLSPWGAFLRRRTELDRLIYDEIRTRRAAHGDAEDVLSMLLEARSEQGEPMSDEEIRDELVSLVVAGHETTATGLAWAFDLLLHEPDALDRARGGEHAYLEAVVKETLRLRPPVFSAGRIVQEPFELDGFRLEPGVRAWAPIVLLHRDPELFPDPGAFRPERFLEGQPPSYAFIPFGGGVRRCIGAAFASLEMRVVLERVLAAVDARAVDPEPERAALHGVTIVPRHGTRVEVSDRSPS
jgi:cytochrome P450 family 135